MKKTIEERQHFLAKRLREEREKQHISQIDLAFKAQLSQNIVALIETGKRIPNINTIFKITDALNISPTLLFENTNEEKENAKNEIIALLNEFLC
ncbi:MAG: helix-turn-helix transcriptional regulator [Treponema sp.]|nr:helix-turn-helix transcriptional regulator [Treponema sp.]